MPSSANHMEFGHIRRIQDTRFPYEVAVILPGEYFVSQEPKVVYTVLGSCISVCLRDPVINVGGMNHFMLAAPASNSALDRWVDSGRYGSFAMEMLINGIVKYGGKKERLEAKVFGGGKIYDSTNNIGAKNAAWAMDYLENEGVPLLKADVGDLCPRKVYFFTDSGKVLMKKLDRLASKTIENEEKQYQSKLEEAPVTSDVTLF
jgi:chemotaxis protein CheD